MPNEQMVRRPLPARPEGDNKTVRNSKDFGHKFDENCDNDLAQYLDTLHKKLEFVGGLGKLLEICQQGSC